jgi:hypothetical protein
MGDWKKERDALISETMAFVRTVRSQMPISTEPIVARLQTSADAEKVASVSPERAQPTFDEMVERHRLQPMKWGGPQREEIKQRIAAFRSHQERFIQERQNYAASTLMRMQASQEQVTDNLTRSVTSAALRTSGSQVGES